MSAGKPAAAAATAAAATAAAATAAAATTAAVAKPTAPHGGAPWFRSSSRGNSSSSNSSSRSVQEAAEVGERPLQGLCAAAPRYSVAAASATTAAAFAPALIAPAAVAAGAVAGPRTVVYSLSRYFARRHSLGEFDQRNVGERLPRAPARAPEPPRFLRRIDTWCPAKCYSAVLDDYNVSSGGGPPSESPSGGPPGGPPGQASGSGSRLAEIEMTERGGPSGGRSVGPPGASGAPLSDAEKEGLGRFIESGCAICFEEFNPSVLVRVLPCRHIFHRSCLDTWFQRSAMCPLCMHDYSRGPPPPLVPTAARGGARAVQEGAPQSVAERFISFRFFSFPGRLRQQH
ncbi:hypothetical protein Esti_003871 [Eimeria stiedai]